MQQKTRIPRHQPAISSESPLRMCVRTFARLQHVHTVEDVNLAVVGLPCDTGATFKIGARFGSEAVHDKYQ